MNSSSFLVPAKSFFSYGIFVKTTHNATDISVKIFAVAHFIKVYINKYGYWRPNVIDVIYKYLNCGDLHQGYHTALHDKFISLSSS